MISPHLDDGVLSCGDLLAENPGAVLVTIFAGRPPAYPPLTSWDERGGFEEGADVVAVRREEDRQALMVLGARPMWLAFPDPQYGTRPDTREVVAALIAALDELTPDVVAVPLGIFHDDHILTGDAAIDALGRRPSPTWMVYADAIYRRVPDLVARRLRDLGERGLTLRELDVAGVRAADHKRRAVACYQSQVRALERSWEGGASDAFEPEQYWQVVGPEHASITSADLTSDRRAEWEHDGDGR